MGKFVCLKLFLFLPLGLWAQGKYWILPSGSEESSYLSSLDLSPTYCSEWLDACSYLLTDAELDLLTKKGIPTQPMATFALAGARLEPAFALEQIGTAAIDARKLTGKGVKVGIIDGGFLDADEAPSLEHFFKNQQVKYYKDYVTPELEQWGGIERLDDAHGSEVWQMIGGVDMTKQVRFGLATGADYYLARTDHGAYEKRIEEDYLIAALESMEKLGVRLVNISLGYNIGFTDSQENYLPEQMDGKTALLTRAVEKAAAEKGMLIVVASGNDGADPWKIVSTPADAEHALVVGATKFDIWDKMDYSSIGADFVDYIKPDVSVFSTLGTSFSAPVITGLAACIMEYDSTLTNFEIMDLLKQSSNFFPFPNNFVGYGVPSTERIFQLLEGGIKDSDQVRVIYTSESKVKLTGIDLNQPLVVFHKKNGSYVVSRNYLKPSKNRLKLSRPEGIDQTSLLMGKEVTEIIWEPKK